jgi:hypothetical protein
MNTKTTIIIITSTIVTILLVLYFTGFIKVEKFQVPRALIPIKTKPKLALCFTAGGLAAMSCIHGSISSFYQKKRLLDQNAKYSSLLKNVRYLSAVSGGSWYGSHLLYNKQFNDAINSTGVINAQSVKQKWIDSCMFDIVLRRTQIRQDPGMTNIIQNLLPAVMGLIVKIILESQRDYLNILANLPSVYGHLIFGSSIDGKTMTNMLKEYKHIIYSIDISINNDGQLNIPVKNVLKEKITYSLDQKGMSRFPCRPGFPSSVDRLYNGSLLTNSTGDAFNSLRQGALSVNPPDPLFDNLLLDTCKFVPKYDRGLFGGRTPTGEKVYRCKNVSAADCCPPTGGNRYNGTKLCTQGIVSSSDLELVPRSVLGSEYMSGKLQYNIYNMKTESAPTGEWPNDTGLIENAGSKRSSAVTDISKSNLNTKHLLVKDASAASGMGFNIPVCLQKSLFYRSGVSDQEEWVKNIMDLFNILGAGIKLEFDNPVTRKLKIYSPICSPTEQYYCALNNIAPKDKMNLLIKNKLVNIADGLEGGDTFGIIANLLQYEKELSSSRNLLPPNIICTTKEETKDYALIPRYFLDGETYNNFQRYSHFKSVLDTANNVTDIVNEVANWNFLIETGVIIASFTVDTVVTLLLNALIPLFGSALSVIITTLVNEAAWFIVDLDIDDHERIVDDANMIFANGKIFNTKYSDAFFTTNYEDVSPTLSIRVRLYKNLPVIPNTEFGIKGGYNIPNLYVIEYFTPVPIFQSLPSLNDTQMYGDLTADVFTGLNRLYDRHQEVKDMFNLLM